jgi:hypothetical protein
MKPNPTPPVDSNRGAPMGRYSGPDPLNTDAGRLYLSRVPINSGGYDAGGAYWGLASVALYCAMDQDGATRFFRAISRDSAKRQILADYPAATFYR